VSNDLRFDLLKWQKEVYQSAVRFIVIMAGRRCGKSRFAIVMTIIKALECKAEDAAVLYVAPTYSMVKILAWDQLLRLGAPVIESSNVNDGRIKLVNGVSIYTRGADNPDSLRGMKLAYCVIDEAKDVKPEVFEQIIRPALSDMKGGALIIGTPDPGENFFNDRFDYAESAVDPEWMARHLTTYDNETIDPEEIAAAKRSMSSMMFEREYMASRASMSQDIFKSEWLLFGPEPENGDWYMAVDPAGFEAVAQGDTKKKHLDNCAIAVVKVCDDGRWFVKKIEFGRWDVREASTRILKNIKDVRPLMIGIEKGSLMRALLPYLSDQMRKFNQYAHIEPIPTSGSNKVSRITYNLQGMFEHGRITLNERENWDQFKKEYVNFPAKGTHDDLLDSLSMVTNLAQTSYARRQDDEEPEVLDEICGF
jgi:hypothetical protein